MIVYHAVTCTDTECAPTLAAEDRRGNAHRLEGCPIGDPRVPGGLSLVAVRLRSAVAARLPGWTITACVAAPRLIVRLDMAPPKDAGTTWHASVDPVELSSDDWVEMVADRIVRRVYPEREPSRG